MTREIIFRGKLRKDGRWCYGNLDVKKNGVNIITPDDTLLGVYGQVDPATVGQFTGLTDKNGNKIFEGDIVTGWFAHEEITGYISYGSNAVFFIERKGLHGIGLNNAADWLVIIGNIHDNPELLEVATK